MSSSVTAATALSMPRFELHRVGAGGDVLAALAVDGLREHRSRSWCRRRPRRTVFDATSRTICAPMFSSGSLRSISFATVTPSLVMMGEPNFLSEDDVACPLGPSVTFTASARRFTPRRIDWRDSSPYVICFAIANGSPLKASFSSGTGRLTSADDREDFVLAEDEDLLAVDLDVGAGVLPEQDLVAHLDVERDAWCRSRGSCRCPRPGPCPPGAFPWRCRG